VTAPFGVAQSLNFGVRHSGAPMETFADDFAPLHQQRAHHWVWRCLPKATSCQAQGP
jgi:hypothetical protein